MKPFILDTNYFIEGYKRYYPPQMCPGFWSFLQTDQFVENCYTIEQVEWEINGDPEETTIPDDKKGMSKYIMSKLNRLAIERFTADDKLEVVEAKVYKKYGHISQEKKDLFLDERKADAHLIAQAMKDESVVVTLERAKEKNQLKIPNVCDSVEPRVKCIDMFELLQELGARFTCFNTPAEHRGWFSQALRCVAA